MKPLRADRGIGADCTCWQNPERSIGAGLATDTFKLDQSVAKESNGKLNGKAEADTKAKGEKMKADWSD